MRSLSRRPKSTLTSDKSLESGVSEEVRRLRVRQESKRTRGCRGRKFRSDRKVAHRCNHFVVIVERAPLRAREDHRDGQIRSIRLDKLLHTRERVRSFVDRNKMCT